GTFGFIDQVLATYDVSGRNDLQGQRYDRQDRSRKPTPYQEAYAHLQLLGRIGRTYPLTSAQTSLLHHRRAAHHRMCLDHALRARSLRAMMHLPPVLLASDERQRLLRDAVRYRGRGPKA